MPIFDFLANKMYGFTALCDHLRSFGIEASVLPKGSPERIEKGRFFRHDAGYVKIEGKNIALIAVRMRRLGSRVNVGPMGMHMSNARIYHYIVRRDPSSNPEAYKAHLKVVKQGLTRHEIGAEWKGNQLASALSSDAEVSASSVLEQLRLAGIQAGLWIAPDTKHQCVRIVQSGLTLGAETVAGVPVDISMNNAFPSKPLFDAIDRIAFHVRNMLA